jgi:hypothetical protein
MRINDILVEFAPAGGGGSGNYFKELASAWYNGTFDTGSLQKGIKSQQDVERLLNRGIVCPDGVTRKLHIDYNSDFDGVEIYSDDYYEYGDYDDTIDSRTGQKWGPYDFMAFSDEDLSESLKEFAADDGDSGGEDDALHKYARMWWAGDEATQMQIEKVLARMGWEIGEDEGGYDNGGVFVVRAGDVNGDSYTSWAAEDLTEATGDQKFDTMMSQMQREPKYPDSQMPPTDVKDLYQWAVKNNKPYHKIFATWANREGYKSVALALQRAGNLDTEALDYWTPDVWKIYWGELNGIDSEMPPEWAKKRVPDELRDYLDTVFDAYDRIVFDWPTEYRQIGGQGNYAEGYTDDDIETTKQFRNAIAGLKARSAIDKAKDGAGAKYYYDGAKVTPQETARRAAERKAKKDKKGMAEAPGAETLGHNQSTVASNEKAFDLEEGNRKSEPPEADYGDDYQDMVKRVKKLAGLGPLKTQYDPAKRVYKNMPTAVQPKK